MMMVGVDTSCLFRWIYGPNRFAWSKGWVPFCTVLHSSDERGELSQWLCHGCTTSDNVQCVVAAVVVDDVVIIRLHHSKQFRLLLPMLPQRDLSIRLSVRHNGASC